MGPKISIDSATLMNKALEFLEASWLFEAPEEKIRVLVHPESIIHGLLELRSGAMVAHLSATDMQGPIGFALSLAGAPLGQTTKTLSLSELSRLSFEEVDEARFPSLSMAREVLRLEGRAGASLESSPGSAGPWSAAGLVFNMANEVAVEKFLEDRISFPQIFSFVETALAQHGGLRYSSLAQALEIETEIRKNLWSS
jgi:1-deoxy-D-xylulose-5-phosphate reductoisomerase